MGVFNSVVADRRHPKLYNMLRSIYQYKYRYRYVGHVSAIERSDLDQDSSCKRPSTIRCGVRSTCLTLPVSLGYTEGGLGRVRVVSRRRLLFSF